MEPDHQINPELDQHSQEELKDEQPLLSWRAPEYVNHDRTAVWYASLIVAFALLAGLTFWATKSWFSIFVIITSLLALIVFYARKPEEVTYSLFSDGFAIKDKHYYYDEFSSFSPIKEAGFYAVVLMPIRKLRPPINLYYNEEDRQKIQNSVGGQMIMKPYSPDSMQKIIDYIKL